MLDLLYVGKRKYVIIKLALYVFFEWSYRYHDHFINLHIPSEIKIFVLNSADSAAVAITTTDLVSKSVAIESEVSALYKLLINEFSLLVIIM